MKKINIAIIIVVLLGFSCKSVSYRKIKVKLPRTTPVKLEKFNELIITNFSIEKDTKEFDLNRELVDYFSAEFRKNYNGEINSEEISFEKKEIFKEPGFWKNIHPDSKDSLFFTGTVEYSKEVRKAILKKFDRRSDDYSATKKSLAERRFFTLIIHIYLIDSQTGEILYERNFKESKGYENPKQTSNFAFFDLVRQVHVKLFRNILGLEKTQQRYLIVHYP